MSLLFTMSNPKFAVSQKVLTKRPLFLIIAALMAGHALPTLGEEVSSGKLDKVKVSADTLGNTTEQTDAYTTGSMNTATRFDLSIRETPQSISVLTRSQMDDFKLNTINDALQNTPGVTVERAETDRTYYTARGFDITNFQEDGVGVPLYWGLSVGDTDTAIYDRIEVVRGADGLASGVGNPSATINQVRKRPTREFQASVSASGGSWNDYRFEQDVSGTLGEGVRGRFVAAEESKDSYLRAYAKDLNVGYGVIEADIGTNTLLTVGVSRQKSDTDRPMWGAVTLQYTDGTMTDFDVSTNPSANWSYWDVQDTKTFVELNHSFDSSWSAKATYSHTNHKENSELFYVFGGLDKATGSGLTGWTGKYSTDRNVDLVDVSANGTFSFGGREHDLVIGTSWARSHSVDTEAPASGPDAFPAIPDFYQWRGDTPRPDFVLDPNSGADVRDRQTAIYAATHLHLTDKFSAIAGVRVASFNSDGDSYNVSVKSSESNKAIPYAGLVYDLNQTYSLYTSYAETFLPQAEEDVNHKRLAPTEGKNTEAGIKGAFFDNSLNVSAAVFKTEHRNIAEVIGYAPNGKSINQGFDYDSEGYELTLAGKLTERWNASLGYTSMIIDDMQGESDKTYIPKQTVKLSTSYSPAALPRLKVGASANWQADVYRRDTPIKQDAYTLLNLFANYQFNDHLSAAVNVNNVTDEKYLSSIYQEQGFYGTPRQANASVTWTF